MYRYDLPFVHFHRPRHMGSGFEFGTGTTYACC